MSCSSPYRMPAHVDHIYYSKYGKAGMHWESLKRRCGSRVRVRRTPLLRGVQRLVG